MFHHVMFARGVDLMLRQAKCAGCERNGIAARISARDGDSESNRQCTRQSRALAPNSAGTAFAKFLHHSGRRARPIELIRRVVSQRKPDDADRQFSPNTVYTVLCNA